MAPKKQETPQLTPASKKLKKVSAETPVVAASPPTATTTAAVKQRTKHKAFVATLDPSKTKLCKLCKQLKSVTEFYHQRAQCIECYKATKKCSAHPNQNQYDCIECPGPGTCKHGPDGTVMKKVYCPECNGSALCIHDPERKRKKQKCPECSPHEFCPCGKKKETCRPCGGALFCKEHNRNRYTCRPCGGSAFCKEHDKRKEVCLECHGSQICEHKNVRCKCIYCNPEKIACVKCKLTHVDKRTHVHPYCLKCYCQEYPDDEHARYFKLKEKHLQEALQRLFPAYAEDFVLDKKIEGGCSARRPDIFIDFGICVMIIECDEDQLRNYKCELKRLVDIIEDIGDRPLIALRFNPDAYVNKQNQRVRSCFTALTKPEDQHKRRFYNLETNEWKRRINALSEVMNAYILQIENNWIPDNLLMTHELFYDNYD